LKTFSLAVVKQILGSFKKAAVEQGLLNGQLFGGACRQREE
jgi:hypothetical protein